jgi:hypothetical protein
MRYDVVHYRGGNVSIVERTLATKRMFSQIAIACVSPLPIVSTLSARASIRLDASTKAASSLNQSVVPPLGRVSQ